MRTFIILIVISIITCLQPIIWNIIYRSIIPPQTDIIFNDRGIGECCLASCFLIMGGLCGLIVYICNQREEELKSLFKPKNKV